MAERLDLMVELVTLGEFGLTANLVPVAVSQEDHAARELPRLRERCDAAPAARACRDGAPTLS